MTDLPIWQECRRCTRFLSTPELPRCPNPFPPSGECPHPEDRQRTIHHPFKEEALAVHQYASLFEEDATMASIFHRWRRGLIPTDEDFLYIRSEALAPAHFEKGNKPTLFLYDILNESLAVMMADFASYHLGIYSSPRPSPLEIYSKKHLVDPIIETVKGCLGVVLFAALPEFIEANGAQGGEWSRYILDQIRLGLWGLYGCKYIRFSENGFRKEFEKEWKILLEYQDVFYGFRVSPKISVEDMVRYQKLPGGDAEIRRQIVRYLDHRATEYPHWLKPWAPDGLEEAFERPHRECFRALVQSLAKSAVQNVTGKFEDISFKKVVPIVDEAQLLQEVEKQLWQMYDEAREKFEFYWDYPAKERPLGKVGFVGFPQDRRIQAQLEALMAEKNVAFSARNFTEIGFTHYIENHLRRWVNTTFPAEAAKRFEISLSSDNEDEPNAVAENLSGEGWNAEENYVPAPTSTITGTDGVPYLTIYQISERSGLTIDQLRRLDRKGFLQFKRVRDICERPFPVNSDIRVYPMTAEGDEMLRIAAARLRKHSSHLEGEEIDRKTAAKLVGVALSSLVKWEAAGLVHPRKKGRIVVYDSNALAELRRIKKKR